MSTKNLSLEKIAALIAGMDDNARNSLGLELKGKGVSITARKAKEAKTVVAKRVNLRDSNPNAKRVRYANTIEYLSAKSLMNTLNTWVKKTKNESDSEHETRVKKIYDNIVNGVGIFKNAILELSGIGGEREITDDLPMRL